MKIYETGIFYLNSLQVTTFGAHDKVVAYRRGSLTRSVRYEPELYFFSSDHNNQMLQIGSG